MSRILARCPNCGRPVARAVRNDPSVRVETGERYSVEALVGTFQGAGSAIREVGVWSPLYGLDPDATVGVRCQGCGRSSGHHATNLLRRLKNADTPR